jgi:eukaryotic-like serine/threonine-protein kinase
VPPTRVHAPAAPPARRGTTAVPPTRRGTAAMPSGNGPRRRPARRWLLALVAVLVAGGVAGAVTLLKHPGGTPAASGSSGSAGASSSPSASWQTYHDPSGFSISLPEGWTGTSPATEDDQFTGAPAGFVLVIQWTHTPAPDALTDWQHQAAAKAAADPTYRQILLQRVSYRGYNTADWEFTNQFHGALTRVIDRTFIVKPGQLAYAIELYGPAATWPAVYASMWQQLLTSFVPGS